MEGKPSLYRRKIDIGRGGAGKYNDSNKLIMIKWENALASFDKGGLGFGSLKAFNLALLQKIAVEIDL
ncbi:hypothetical protein Tco_1241255 [Tanacetum coccineum]